MLEAHEFLRDGGGERLSNGLRGVLNHVVIVPLDAGGGQVKREKLVSKGRAIVQDKETGPLKCGGAFR